MAVSFEGNLVGPVVSLTSGLVLAGFAAWIGVQLAIKRFYSERFFERRYLAYEAAIGAVADLHYELLREAARQAGATHIPDFDIERLQAPIKVLHRSVAFGELLFSEEMSKLLSSLGPTLNSGGADLQASINSVSRVLVEANKIAVKDLPRR